MGSIGNEIIRLKEVDSTNRYFMDWLNREKPAEGTLVIADNQTAGRGVDGARWESQHSRNLTFSFVLYPEFLAIDAQFYLNKMISLGLADSMEALLKGHRGIRIKWPNDIYIDDRKVAGTLVQNGVKGSRFEFVVVGIGLNVNQMDFPGDAGNPVSLQAVAGYPFDLDSVLGIVLERIERRYEQLKQGQRKLFDEDYLRLLYRIQQLSDYIYKEKQVKARITGVDRYGRLILEIPGEKIIECDLKEIKFKI